MMRKTVLATVGLVVLVSLVAPLALAEDLPSDPRVLSGTLENGVHWMLREHANPPEKVSLMFHVKSGSLMEEESQRGLAHFFEHMAFNGSEHFPPGKLLDYFQSIGMQFGADINAFTSFDQTAFMLFLSTNELQQIDKGLMALSDQAFRASLSEEEIDKERGVILSEIRAGRGADQRLRDKLWPKVFAGSHFAERMVLGLETVIENATREDFLDYYRTWFRPERITVLVVGDVDSDLVVPLIEKWFGQYEPTVPAREALGAQFKLFKGQRAFVATDPDFANAEIEFLDLRTGRPPRTTVETARRDLVEQIGSWILQRRFAEQIRKGEADYLSADLAIGDFFNDATVVWGTANSEPAKWEPAFEQVLMEINRTRQFGFTQREFELAQTELMAGAERAVETESTQNARGLLMRMMGTIGDGSSLLSAQQELELLQRLLPTIKLEEINATFAAELKPDTFAFALKLPEKEDVEVPSDEQLLAAARAALARKVEPPAEEQRATELLEEEPTPGKIVQKEFDEDLEVTTYWLTNGACVHHRFMDYKKDQVQVTIVLGGARLEETAANAGISEVAALAFEQPATSRLTSSEIEDIMTGKKIGVRGAASGDALTVSVGGSPKDLETGLKLAHVLLTDGQIEESAFKNWVDASLQRYKQLSKLPPYAAYMATFDIISGSDPRMVFMDDERIKKQSREAAQAWFTRLCKEAPLEVTVVGEMQRDDVMPLITKYIGSLPERSRDVKRLESLRKITPATGPVSRRIEIETITPQGMGIYGFVPCDGRNIADVRALQLAAQTLDTRVIKHIREELGMVYSIQVQCQPMQSFHDTGVFASGAPCDPGKADELIVEVKQMFADFAANGPTEEELAEAKKQILSDLDEDLKEPRYWSDALRYLHVRGYELDRYKGIEDAYQAFTCEQVRDVFAKYCVPARQFDVTVVPASKLKKSEDEDAQEPLRVAP